MEYKIKFPIGDWGGQGHKQCDTYVILSNKSYTDLVTIHKQCKSKLGFDISFICDESDEYSLKPDIKEILILLNIISVEFALEQENDGLSSSDLLDIWLKLLVYIDPSFKYEIIEDYVPCMGTYVHTPGFGLFCI